MDIEEDAHSTTNYGSCTNAQYGEGDGCSVVTEYIATLLLKLESVHHVSILCID